MISIEMPKINIWSLRCRKLWLFSGKFLDFGKSAGVKVLTNIMSGSGGLFATKMDMKRPFEIRIVAKFSTFYGKHVTLDIFLTDLRIFLS